MKLNKFYFAALAAMTIVSCSNEQDIVSPNSVPDLKPGEALVTFNLTGRGATRASDAEESAIKLLRYNVYLGEGDTIAVNRRHAGNNTVSFTIPAAKVEELKDQEIKILVLANAADQDLSWEFGKKLVEDSTNPNATNYKYDKMLEVKKDLSKELATAETGLPGSAEASFIMKSGMINIDPESNKLKRAVSRIYVTINKGTGVENISGTIQFKNIMSSTYIFQSNVNGGSPMTIPETPLSDVKEQVVAYVYPTYASYNPSADITINGITKTLTINKNLEKNKNYAININITAQPMEDGTVDYAWTPTFGGWEDGNIGDSNFVVPGESIIKNTFTPTEGTTLNYEDGVFQTKVYGEFSATTTDMFVDGVTDLKVVKVEEVGQTRANALEGITSSDGLVTANFTLNGFSITASNTAVGAPKRYNIIIQGTLNGKTQEYALPVVVEGYPENFSATANGIEVMTVGLQAVDSSDPSAIIDIVEEINKQSGANFAEKSKNYLTLNSADYQAKEQKLLGTRVSATGILNGSVKCPAGFRVPTKDEIKQLFGWAGNNGSKQDVTVDVEAQLGTIDANNKILLASNPLRHWLFTPASGEKLFMPSGQYNATSGFQLISYIFTYGSTSAVGRFIFTSNPTGGTPQLREGVTGGTASTFIRCVREAANQ